MIRLLLLSILCTSCASMTAVVPQQLYDPPESVSVAHMPREAVSEARIIELCGYVDLYGCVVDGTIYMQDVVPMYQDQVLEHIGGHVAMGPGHEGWKVNTTNIYHRAWMLACHPDYRHDDIVLDDLIPERVRRFQC